MRRFVVVLSLFAAVSLMAAQPEDAQTGRSVIRLTPAALQAAIDPATGQLRRLTAQEAREVRENFTKSLQLHPLVPRVAADGSVSLNLDDSFLNFYMARVTPEGDLQFECVNEPGDALAILVGAPAPASVMRRSPEKGAGQPAELEEK